MLAPVVSSSAQFFLPFSPHICLSQLVSVSRHSSLILHSPSGSSLKTHLLIQFLFHPEGTLTRLRTYLGLDSAGGPKQALFCLSSNLRHFLLCELCRRDFDTCTSEYLNLVTDLRYHLLAVTMSDHNPHSLLKGCVNDLFISSIPHNYPVAPIYLSIASLLRLILQIQLADQAATLENDVRLCPDTLPVLSRSPLPLFIIVTNAQDKQAPKVNSTVPMFLSDRSRIDKSTKPADFTSHTATSAKRAALVKKLRLRAAKATAGSSEARQIQQELAVLAILPETLSNSAGKSRLPEERLSPQIVNHTLHLVTLDTLTLNLIPKHKGFFEPLFDLSSNPSSGQNSMSDLHLLTHEPSRSQIRWRSWREALALGLQEAVERLQSEGEGDISDILSHVGQKIARAIDYFTRDFPFEEEYEGEYDPLSEESQRFISKIQRVAQIEHEFAKSEWRDNSFVRWHMNLSMTAFEDFFKTL